MDADVDVLVANRRTWSEAWAGVVGPLLSSWGKELRLVVCDDCSGIDEVKEIHKWLPRSAELVVNVEHRGVPATFNRLLEVSTAPYRLLVNSDCQIPKLREIVKLCEVVCQTSGLAIVGTAEGPRFLDETGAPYTLAPGKDWSGPTPQGYVSGCCMMMPGVGKISELRFEESWSKAYYEDTDMSYRARANGWRTLWVRTEIEHIGQVALSREAAASAAGSFEEGPEMWKARAKKRFLERWAPFLRPECRTYREAVAETWEVDEVLRREGPSWLVGS